jgi:hypothetical protein
MNKFWEWMREKQYHGYYAIGINTIHDKMNTSCRPTNQMLIGYMIEYISSHEIFKKYTSPFLDGKYSGIELRMSMLWQCKKPYDELVDIIKLIDGE